MLAIVMDSKVLETAPMPEVATDVVGSDGCCNVESIREFTSIFVDICYATSYPFGFTSIGKHPPLDILKFLVTTLRNQDKKVAFIGVDEYGSLSKSSDFMKTCHNMYIIV